MKAKETKLAFLLLIPGMIFLVLSGCKKEAIPPTLTTSAISAIALTTASGGGSISSDGGATITARGVCWSTNATPTISDSKTSDGSGEGNFTSSVTGLTPNTNYNVRAYATNSAGTGYGDELIFTSYAVLDFDGNGYHAVAIGTQVWMKENLKTTSYSDGTAIPNVADVTAWYTLSSGANSIYANSSDNLANYGRLYNWYAVTDAHQLCPTGWHAPNDTEWDVLANYLGGANVAGGKMKATGNNQAGIGLWDTPNTSATNESGFTGLPGGEIGDTAGGPPSHFTDIRGRGHWWSTNGFPGYGTWRYLSGNDAILGSTINYAVNGKSVRCLKN